ncbi:uncharacterized protein LOC124434575 [Xenia sp. Carnegie-2017]|uniref:uncharacterized protein LOC124434575 n=1 Tax=Xenia sp. Carnegie-2017 TaxID=2897299 RepID=UPI001F04D857|nr:uncharacterized protein LOC124434575 [Xenia sp. Carnegie-2017]
MLRKQFTFMPLILTTVIGGFCIFWIDSLLFKTIQVPTQRQKPLSLIVKEKYDTGPILTQKSSCFLCEDEDYGMKWKSLVQNESCQNEMYERCFQNVTKNRRSSTQVLSIVRRCQLQHCKCSNLQTRDWCMTSQCGVDLYCCEEKHLQCFKIFNYWLYTYFRS